MGEADVTVAGLAPDGAPGKPASLSERLAAGLLDLIAGGGLGPGDPLPSVKTLAARFSVTAPTMREALRRLQATEAIELRHGSGVYVGLGVHRTLLPNPNSAVADHNVLALQLVEARLVIEPGIAALAAVHRGADDLERLTLSVETATRDPEDSRPHLNFHRELAKASGNQVLYEVVDSLMVVRNREQRAVRRMISDRQRDHREHTEILDAVRDGDAAAAEHLTREHLRQLRYAVSTPGSTAN